MNIPLVIGLFVLAFYLSNRSSAGVAATDETSSPTTPATPVSSAQTVSITSSPVQSARVSATSTLMPVSSGFLATSPRANPVAVISISHNSKNPSNAVSLSQPPTDPPASSELAMLQNELEQSFPDTGSDESAENANLPGGPAAAYAAFYNKNPPSFGAGEADYL